jgi:hypothetical protein
MKASKTRTNARSTKNRSTGADGPRTTTKGNLRGGKTSAARTIAKRPRTGSQSNAGTSKANSKMKTQETKAESKALRASAGSAKGGPAKDRVARPAADEDVDEGEFHPVGDGSADQPRQES